MNEVVLNGKQKEEGVTWDRLEDGQLAEVVDTGNYSGIIVQKLWSGSSYSMVALGSGYIWNTSCSLRLRPLKPGESVTITVE